MHIGERIKLARGRARLSLDELAGRMGTVTKQALSKYEIGKMSPSSSVLMQLSVELGVTLDFLLRPTVVQLGDLKFRKLAKLPAKDRKAIEADVQDYLERLLILEQIVYGEECPRFAGLRNQPVHELDDAETAAAECRRALNLGVDPIANLTALLDLWCVRTVPTQAVVGFDAVSTWVQDHIAVIAVNNSQDIPGDRQRFSMAHELGHLVMDVDERADEEKACNRFAGAFLFPRDAVRLELGDSRTGIGLQELRKLKQLYGVSMQTIVFRAHDCDVIDERIARSLHIRISRLKVGRVEPFEQYPREQAELGGLDRLVDRALAEQFISEGRAMEFRH